MEVGASRSPQYSEQDVQGEDGWARGHQRASWPISHNLESADVTIGDYHKDKDTGLVRKLLAL